MAGHSQSSRLSSGERRRQRRRLLREQLETAVFDLPRDDKIALLMSALLHDRDGVAEASYSMISSGCTLAELIPYDFDIYLTIRRLREAIDRLDARTGRSATKH